MRIVGGKHKGKALSAPKGKTTRPTSDRARESVFNVLAHGIDGIEITNARIADVFAGTGALGLEALSRGGIFCIFIESEKNTIATLRQNIAALGEEASTSIISSLAEKAPVPPGGAVDIAFLDAPYGNGLTTPALERLVANGWFRPGSIAIIEVGKDEKLELPTAFNIIKEKISGAAKHVFARYMA